MKVGITPYLFFDGRCREAFEHYARVLGGRIAFIMLYGQAPEPVQSPPGWEDKVIHASLEIGDQAIMGGDAPPGHQKTPQGFSTSLTVASIADAERVFAGLSQGGHIYMPLAQTFFSERFGMLTDRFGMSWMVNFPGRVDVRDSMKPDERAAAGNHKPAAGKPGTKKPAAKQPRTPSRRK